MKLKFNAKEVYGRPLYYPVNENAIILTVMLAKKKTLSEPEFEALKKLKGAKIECTCVDDRISTYEAVD